MYNGIPVTCVIYILVVSKSNIFPMSKEASNTFIHIVGIATFGLMIP